MKLETVLTREVGYRSVNLFTTALYDTGIKVQPYTSQETDLIQISMKAFCLQIHEVSLNQYVNNSVAYITSMLLLTESLL